MRFVAMLLRQRNCGAHDTTAHVTVEPARSSSDRDPQGDATTSNRRKTRGETAYVEADWDDESGAEYDPTTEDLDGIENWEDELVDASVEDEEDDIDDPTDIIDDPGQEYFVSLSVTQKDAIDKLQRLLECTPPAADRDILESFGTVILQAFISQPSDTDRNPYHAPIEAYLISRGMKDVGGFRSSRGMSNTFSKLQYAGLYTILRECVKPDTQPLP